MAARAETLAQGDAEAASSSAALDEVVVTARKRAERLEDVPIAVSVVDSKVLRDANHFRIQDVNDLTPNVNNNVVNGHQTSFVIRGLGNNPGNDGLEYSAGVFLDGVYLARPGMASVDMLDISQVEVLRGPQGTLFGKNTTAGAVNITTLSPSFTASGLAQASAGNYGYRQYQGMLAGPVAGDVLAARVSAYKTTRDGHIRNVIQNRDEGVIDREGVRGQLLYQPNDDLSLRLIADYAREDNDGVMIYGNLGVTPAALAAKLAAAGGVVVADPHGRLSSGDGPVDTATRQYGFSGELNWKVAGFTLTSISAYRHWHYASLNDVEGSSADFFSGGYDVEHAQWTQELRLAFPSLGPVDLVTGAYYFQQDIDMQQIQQYGSQSAAWLTGIPNAQLPAVAATTPAVATLLNYNGSRWVTRATPQTRSYALFGQAVWRVNDRLNLTAGLRETYETKEETVGRANPTATATGQPRPGLAAFAVAPVHVAIKDWSTSFLLSADYRFNPGLMGYAFVSRGEKAGGVNSSLPPAGKGPDALKVRPERATDYEIGLKSRLFDGKLSFSAGLFYTDVRDYQATYYATLNNTTISILGNVEQVLSRGAEFEASAQPVTGLTLHASVGYNKATYGSYPNGPCPLEVTGRPTCDFTDQPIVGAPKWTANAYGAYERPLGDNLIVYGRAEYGWRSEYYGYQDNSVLSRTGNYGLVNLYAGVKLASGRLDLMVWGRNVTNEHYAVSFSNLGSLVPGVYLPQFGDPRTYGATLRASF